MDVRSSPRWFAGLLVVALVMALALSLVSVHLRLVNSGLGCADWPDCYGRIGAAVDTPRVAPGETADAPASLATRAHRAIASALGLVILVIVAAALTRHTPPTGRLAPTLLLMVMVGLAVLGKWSAGLHRPGVVMANFTGGIALAALLWWLLLASGRGQSQPRARRAAVHRWASAALLLVAAQIVLGGLVSAYFAGLACGPSPTCAGNWMPSVPWHTLTGLFDVLEIDTGGRVVGGHALTGLHMAHRLLGVLAAVVVALLAWRLRQEGRAAMAVALLALVVIEAVLGLASVHLKLDRGVVLAHYALALALLLALLTLVAPAGARRAAHRS